MGRKLGGVAGELAVDHPDILDRVAPLAAREVDHVQKQPAAVGVTEKIVPQPEPLRRPLDQPGDVGANESAPLSDLNHAEIGGKGGEMVVRDLGEIILK